MNKRTSVWLIALFLIVFGLAGCGSGRIVETADGTRFLKPSNLGGYDFLRDCKEEDVYICDIREVTASELEVPATFRNRPVIAVIGHCTEANEALVTLKISEGIRYLERIENFRALNKVELPSTLVSLNDAFQSCPALEEITVTGDIELVCGFSFQKCSALERVTFLGNVQTITDFSFRECHSLKDVVFQGHVGAIERYSFNECPALTSIVLSGDTVLEETVFARPRDYSPEFVSDAVLDYCRLYNADALKEQARTVLGQPFDPEKEISAEKAADFSDRFNGPILAMDQCPDCHYSQYSAQVLPEGLALSIIDVSEIEYTYSGTVFSPEKAERVYDGTAPLLYCLCEVIGYSDGPEYTFSGRPASYLWYRISLWEQGSNELIAWYTCKNGSAPGTYTLGKDRISYSLKVGEKNMAFFLNADRTQPTPLTRVIRDFYGLTEKTRRVEIIYR